MKRYWRRLRMTSPLARDRVAAGLFFALGQIEVLSVFESDAPLGLVMLAAAGYTLPLATARIPATSCSGGTSLSRNPLAPARSVGLLRACMFKRVGQALLHEPVGGQVEAGRELRGLAVDPQPHGKARPANLFDQAVELLQPRVWRERGWVLGVA